MPVPTKARSSGTGPRRPPCSRASQARYSTSRYLQQRGAMAKLTRTNYAPSTQLEERTVGGERALAFDERSRRAERGEDRHGHEVGPKSLPAR